MRKLLDVKKGSLGDHAMDAILSASADQDSWLSSFERANQVNAIRKMAPSSQSVQWLSQNFLTGMRKPRGVAETSNQYMRYLSGHSAPFHMGASEPVGNALVRLAVSSVASEPMANSLATSVLGPKFNDLGYRKLVGAMVKERDLLASAPNGRHVWTQGDSPVKDMADYQAKLNDPDIQRALQWHDNVVAAQNKIFGGNGSSHVP
jgi:hypothetical protein